MGFFINLFGSDSILENDIVYSVIQYIAIQKEYLYCPVTYLLKGTVARDLFY